MFTNCQCGYGNCFLIPVVNIISLVGPFFATFKIKGNSGRGTGAGEKR